MSSMDAAQHAHLQSLLRSLHRQLALVSSAPPAPSASAALDLPSERPTAADLVAAMRRRAADMYAEVLTDEERAEAAEKAAWTPPPTARAAAAVSSATAPLPSDSSAPASSHGVAAATATTATVQASGALFHRFSVPLASLLDDFLSASSSVRSVVSYHTALISALQNAPRAPPQQQPGAQAGATGAPPTAQLLNQQSRTFLFTLKQRVELQRQAARVQGNFNRALFAIQLELQRRHQRHTSIPRLLTSGSPIDENDPEYGALPHCDLFGLAAALAVVRSQLALVNSSDDPAAACTILPPGELVLASHLTSDGRDVLTLDDADAHASATAAAAAATRIECASLAVEKHVINLSSTGTSTCFVHDIILMKPLVRTPADRAAVAALHAQVGALPLGLLSLHPQSSLRQVLSHGFCIHGKFETLAGAEYLLDSEGIALLFERNLAGFREKVARIVEAERVSEAHPQLELWRKQEEVLPVMQQEAADSAGLPAVVPTAAGAGLLVRARLSQRIEGPCLTYEDVRCAGAPALTPAALPDPRSSLSFTFVGVEKVYEFGGASSAANANANAAAAAAASPHPNAMDTGSNDASAPAATAASATTTSTSLPLPFTFAYRFVLSQAVLLPFADAQRLFAWPAAASAATSNAAAAPAFSSSSPGSLSEGSYYQVLRGRSVPFLLDEAGASVSQQLFGRRQVYRTSVPVATASSASSTDAFASPALLVSSFLCRSLDLLPAQMRAIRQACLLERLCRSAMEAHRMEAQPQSESPKPLLSLQSQSQSANQSLGPVVRAPPLKLKFSHRQLAGLDDTRAAAAAAARPGPGAEAASAAAALVHFELHLPRCIVLRTAHPTTGAPLQVRIELADAAAQPPAAGSTVASVTVTSAANGFVPSDTYATTLLRNTASLPLMMHYLLDRCAKGKAA